MLLKLNKWNVRIVKTGDKYGLGRRALLMTKPQWWSFTIVDILIPNMDRLSHDIISPLY